MKKDKRIMVVFGVGVLLMLAAGGVCAGPFPWVDKTFTDDFNRPDVTGTNNLGPGWLSATNATGPDYLDHWDIASQVAQAAPWIGVSAAAYVTNFTLGRIWQVSQDLQHSTSGVGAWSVFGRRYMAENGSLVGVHQSHSSNVWMQIYDRAGGYHAIPGAQSAASLTDGTWYRLTLYRSNLYVRATFVGTNANLDTGWLTNYVEEVFDDVYAGTGGNPYGYKFDNVNVTTYRLPSGTIITIY